MSSTKSYDVIIIGSGPGGYVAAIRAAQLGLTVLIVEKEPRLGGVCTLWGCIPTKALLHTADLLEEARHGAEVGVAAREVRLDMPAALKHKEKIVRQSTNGVSYLMKKNRVDIAAGFGRLAGSGQSVRGRAPTAPRRCTPARTSWSPRARRLAPLPGMDIDEKTVLSSTGMLELSEVPKSLVVIGSGAVGVEFASMYARFGSKVTIVEVLPRIVPVEDEDISRELAASFKRQGIAIYPDTRVERMTRGEAGVEILARSSGDKTETFRAEKVLMAVGRTSADRQDRLRRAGDRDREGIREGRRLHADQRSRRLRDRRRPARLRPSRTWPPPKASSPSSTWPARRPVRSTTTRCPAARTAPRRSGRSV